MKRRILSVLAAVMVAFSLAAPSFADTGENAGDTVKVPDAVALVEVDNPECRLINEIGDLNVKIVFKEDGREIVTIPVERVEETDDDTLALWLGYGFNQVADDIKQKMEGFQANFHLQSWDELKKILESSDTSELERYLTDMEKSLEDIFANYTVELTGLPEAEDHEFKTETGAMLMTSELANELLAIVRDIVSDALELTDAEKAGIVDFSSMIKTVENKMRQQGYLEEGEDMLSALEALMEKKFTDEERAQINKEIADIDAVLNYVRDEKYSGTVIAGVYVTCGCPVSMEYEIIHQYFKEVNGKMKLAGTEQYGPEDGYYSGFTGDMIKAADYIKCEYKGETYEYIGSYDSEAELYDQKDVDEFYSDEDWWSESRMDEFVLDDDDDSPFGLVLRYELKDSAGSGMLADNGNPQTGDNSFIELYAVLLLISAVGVIAVIVSNRRHGR